MSKLVLKSEQQILAGMAQTILARTGLNDLNPGSILLTLLQAAAQQDFAQFYYMLQIIRNYNLDTTTGTDLDNRAFEYGLIRRSAIATTGRITILRDASFVKVSQTFYTGFRSRIAGDTQLFLNNAVGLPTSGPIQTLIIGRNTPNEEEVQYVPSGSNPQNNINYFTVTLVGALTNDHTLDESVILKQGADTFIASGTVVVVPATGRTNQITFNTTVAATILAGEVEVDDVNVACTAQGVVGNIGVNSITGATAFRSPPFVGARAQNPTAFSNGQDKETDTSLRNRVKAHIQAISQSTKAGISNAINGLVDSTTAKSVVSSNIILPDNVGLPVKIYIDDGTGFEPDFTNQGQEVIVASAQGQETRLQLALFPLVKAQVETLNQEPFDFSTNGLTLNISVGQNVETITFITSEFAIPEAASAFEIIKVINANSSLVEARTAAVGTKIVLSAKSDVNEDIQILGGTANSASKLNFPTSRVQTFYLYKNDVLLSKDGQTAFIDSGSSEPFDFSGPDRTLSVTVDGKTANIQSAIIHQSDFTSAPAAAAATANQLAVLINNQMAGVTAEGFNGKLRLISNTQLSSASKIQVNTSTANTVLNFSTNEVDGKNQDYKLNPELGVIELTAPLVKYDLLTAGTRNTRGYLTASIAQNYTFTGGETLSIVIDGGSTQTITFLNAISQTANQVATFINSFLVGGTATSRTIGPNTFLEIRTNSLNSSTGSISILSSSTSNVIFGFQTNTTKKTGLAHTAYVVSGSSGPYAFVESDTLVVVVDNDFAGKNYVINMQYAGTASSGTSTTVFAASGLINTFPITGSLINFWIVFKSGANTITGLLDNVTNPTTGTFRYYYKNPAPTNFQSFTVGDQASFSGMNSANNNGNFLITAATLINVVHNPVTSQTISNPSALTPLTGDRYLVALPANKNTNPNSVLDLNISNPSGLSPSVNDRHIIAPAANNVTQLDVKGQYTDSANPAVQQIHGYRYIINGSGQNAWTGHNNQIAQYNGIGTPGWLFITPSSGDVVYDENLMLFYQFNSGSGTWIQNDWGGKAGRVATWNGTIWIFTTPVDQEVRNVTSLTKVYQYSVSTNLWIQNDWGGQATKIAEYSGFAWTFEPVVTNDTVVVTSENKTYQYNGSIWIAFKFWIEVANNFGSVELVTAAGTGFIGQRRRISAYNGITGQISIATPTRVTPTVGDSLIILPSTKENIVVYFNNTKITALSTKANIELVNNASRIQISSQSSGSNGFIQVTGGKANQQLAFSTTLIEGLRAYSYYIGLIKLVHSTIYGDETDLITFPGVGAAGVKFIINGPTVQEIAFVVNVTLQEGLSLSSVENDVQTQVISYVNTVGVAKPVILANIIEAVMGLQGIVDVKIQTPSSNVAIAQNERAVTKAILIAINQVF